MPGRGWRCGPLVSLRCLRDLAQRSVMRRHVEHRLHDAEPRGLKSHRKAGSLPSHLDKCWTLMGSFFGGLRWTGVLGSKFLGSGTCPEAIVVVGKGWGVRGGWWWGSLASEEDGKRRVRSWQGGGGARELRTYPALD